MEQSSKEAKYIRAKERVEELKKFYSNLTSYVVIISGLGVVNYYLNGWSYMWFLWAAFGWGIGIIFHAISTFNLNPLFGKGWEERKIKEYIDNDKDQTKWQ